MITRVHEAMEEVFKDVSFGIDHTDRVCSRANEIMAGENIPEDIRQVIALAAILHDIGAVEAQHKYGSMEGHFQEVEGPAIAQRILEQAGAKKEVIDRVCYLVGHHHTPSKIDGIDFQILWEADLLENLLTGEHSEDQEALRREVQENFKTATGKNLALRQLNLPGS